MRVFVLCTGRTGSLSFARACAHITNYTIGHESKARTLGKDRFQYADQHIEADNRLSWFLGSLDRSFGNEAFYVHLIRDKEEVVKSYNRRWVRNGSLIRAYCEGILQITLHKLDSQKRLEVGNDFYEHVNDNIRHFLKDKEHKTAVHIENIYEEFPKFWDLIGAEGDLDLAIQSFEIMHNQSKTGKSKHLKHELRFRLMKFRRRFF